MDDEDVNADAPPEMLTGDALTARLIQPNRAVTTRAYVDIDGVGTLEIRALTRNEVLRIRRAADMTPKGVDGLRTLALEREMLVLGIVDPIMTKNQVTLWQENGPVGEVDRVATAIQQLSGMDDGTGKRQFREVRK
jgi:hypothetical protein